MTFWFGVWLLEVCIRVVFFGIFDKLFVSKRRWITSTRWVLQCFWYICVRAQLKSDINNVIKDVVFYNDLQNISYASISSPANPPRHPITDKLRTTVSQPSVWLPLRHMDWVQKWTYTDISCCFFIMNLWIQAATFISQNAWFYIVFFSFSVRSESWEPGSKIDGFQALLVFTILLRQGPAQPALKKIL